MFMQLKILEKTKNVPEETVSFKLERKDEAGNYIKYKPGQFIKLDLDTKKDKKGPERCLSLSSSPSENFLMFTTKMRDSLFKQKLDHISPGTNVSVKPPSGKFTFPNDKTKDVIFISGGIGVTPFRSMLKYSIDMNLPTNILMIDSNKSPQQILFKSEFDQWQKINKNLRIVYTLTGPIPKNWYGETGRIDENMLRKYLSQGKIDNSVFFVCGPPQMVKELKKVLEEDLNVKKENLIVENFTGY